MTVTVAGSFVPDYLVLVFFASCGVFQMAAACNGLHGLLFFKGRRTAFIFGLALWVAAFVWFFLSESRNQPDTTLGLTGNQQFGFFFVGSAAGLTFTLLISSLRNLSLGKDQIQPGLDALRQSNYLRALHGTLRPWVALLRGRSFTGPKPRIGGQARRQETED